MLIPKVKDQIAKYLSNECKDLTSLKSEGSILIKDVFREIFQANRDKLDNLGRDLEKLMVISLDLTESVFGNISSGNILAATVILRWQIVISQLAFVCSNNQDIYRNWHAGIGIKESRLRSFLKTFKAADKVPKYDPDEVAYESYSDIYHMKYDQLNGAMTYCTTDDLDKAMKIDINTLLLESQKYTYRILLAALEYTKRKCLMEATKHYKLVDRWNKFQDKFFLERDKIHREREVILNEANGTG